MKKARILIVDDSYDMLEVLQRQLSALQYDTFQAPTVNDAIDILQNTGIDLLITDMQMPGIDGMELVKYVSRNFQRIPVLVITGFPSVTGAVEAVKSGANDYLIKPFTAKELEIAIDKTLKQHYGENLNNNPQGEIAQDPLFFGGLIGKSQAMLNLIDLIQRVSNNKVTTLITGESGTGKELVARAIHNSGKFREKPFIAVNCGAIPENLLESELFGYTKGSFTGATETRTGLFQAANGGTIFLDEIGSASYAVQTKLLRVIQEKEIIMIGTNNPIKIDVRIITATNSELSQLVKKGTFREDLYYRLNVISIAIPPLRDRIDDIKYLVDHFLKKYSSEFNKPDITLSNTVYETLNQHTWPGNIRELENIIQRAIILCDNEITKIHLPNYLNSSTLLDKNDGQFENLEELEYHHIMKVLDHVNNNKSEAARILGINRKTLREKIQKHRDT